MMKADDEVLRQVLQGGARDSREIKTAMEAAGVTGKRTRRARERLGVVVVRFGSGAAAGSRWSLPPLVPATNSGGVLRKGKVPPSTAPSESLRSVRDPNRREHARELGTTEGQLAMLRTRVAAFIARGIEPHRANGVAESLLDRDRAGQREGSCAECQNYSAPDHCAATQFSGGARPVDQLWFCWYARRSP